MLDTRMKWATAKENDVVWYSLDPPAVSFRGDLLTPANDALAGQIDQTLCKVMKDSIPALYMLQSMCHDLVASNNLVEYFQ
jgi:hypothetical protein